MINKTFSSDEIQEASHEAFIKCKNISDGKNADYIPYLADIPSNLFGLSVTMIDGRTFDIGDTNYVFGVESISKVFTAILVMKQYGAGELLKKIGADATGLPFNSIFAILLENDCPSTPLVNAGAITACSMVKGKGNGSVKWESIISNFNDLTGEDCEVIQELYISESQTNFNNRSIAWLLKKYNRIYDDPDLSLDLYTRQCSVGITSRQLSVCAATIANNGVNPVTKKTVFEPSISPKITSLMATVGLYQKTGDWMFQTGIPAKSGVGGGFMAVVPGIMGIGVFSPPLDFAGNSVKAQAVVNAIGENLNLNIFS